MKRRFAALTLAASSVFGSTLPAVAAGSSSPPARPATAMTVFRLHIIGHAGPHATFWVAYGPLAGRFGIVQLRRSAPGIYEAARTLPTSARSTFTYVEGTGSIKTHAGMAPGNPVTTVKTVGPMAVWPRGLPEVTWQVPAG